MRTILTSLIGISLLVLSHAFAAENSQPGLVGEYYALGDALEDFPSIAADKKPTLKRVDKNINVDSTTEALPGTGTGRSLSTAGRASCEPPKTAITPFSRIG